MNCERARWYYHLEESGCTYLKTEDLTDVRISCRIQLGTRQGLVIYHCA